MRRILMVLIIALASIGQAGAIDQIRLTPGEIVANLYTIRLSIPANTKIQAHTHRDDRSAIVMSGTWYFGYGRVADERPTEAMAAGIFYTEPGGVAHFALTKGEPVVVYITGFGPTDTVYLNAANDPREN
jgi:uncharacterized RmlC-like cupin family protein